MSETPAKFVWYDLMTSDIKAAEKFYAEVVGWDIKDSGMPGPTYMLLSVGETMVGGLMPIPEHAAGALPTWMGYVGVDDVDAYSEKVKAAGGAIHRAAQDIPNIGRFAVVADPQGASFILFRGMGDAPAPVALGTPGHIGWHELQAVDVDSAFAFYSGIFGWTRTEAMDMGAMGTYQMFATGGDTVGGMMKKMPEVPAPFWLYYFNVSGIDAAAERVKQAGGQVIHGPIEVPGTWIVQCLDPQGAMFAMSGPKG